jgi:hypothetical protein
MTSHRDDELDRVLDRTLDEIRNERPERAVEQAAADRVWQRLSRELDSERVELTRARRIESCDDFQSMLPDYLAGRLSRSRHLLLEDHLGECVPCRRALKERRAARRPSALPRQVPSRSWTATMGWRVAAAAVVFLTLIGFTIQTDLFSIESGGLIRIESVDGELFHVTDDGAVPLKTGDVLTLEGDEGIRTAKDSSAMIAMADDSRVEIRERSQLAVRQRRHLLPGRQPDGLLDLERGSIIVQASDQGSGHLYVDTRDCNVAVTGTVFSVSHGMKGSRVSVVEGEVRVDQRGVEHVLYPGDQATTRDALNRIPVEQDIAWSRNSDQYLALLGEMRALGRALDEAIVPELRYSTDLLDISPGGTVVYFAMPNMSDDLGRAYEILQDRVSTSVVLRQWWEEEVLASGDAGTIEQTIERIRTFGDYLGEEIVMTLQLGPDGDLAGPLFLARLTSPDSFMQTLSDQISELEAAYDEDLKIALLEGALSTVAPHPRDAELYIRAQDDVLAMTPEYENLWALEAALRGHDGASVGEGAFHDRLSGVYDDGVEWVVGVDIRRLFGIDPSAHEPLDQMGLLDIEHLIGERKQRDGRTENRAVLTFDQPRRRLASWIAEPAPMGALDYISPDANLVGAFVMKDMGVVVEELFELIGEAEANFEQELAEFEQEQSIDIRRDVANPLGGEFAIALDGPLLPTPSWKVVIEVYDPGRLQQTLEWIVEQVSREMTEAGSGQGLTLQSEQLAGREYFRLESLDTGLALQYVFDDGYLVAGPSRGLLDRALQNRAAGIRLTDSPAFIDLLPRDGEVNFSGVLYQNMAPVLNPLSSTLETMGSLPDEQRQFVQALAAEAKPSLALLYGHPDRIALASSSEGGLFSSMMDQLSGATSLLGMQQSLARALHDGAGAR